MGWRTYLGHQLGVLGLVLRVQPVGHRGDERLHDVLLVGLDAGPEGLAEVLHCRVPQLLEGDPGGAPALGLAGRLHDVAVTVSHCKTTR